MRLFKCSVLLMCMLSTVVVLAGCPTTGIAVLVAKSTITVGETTTATAVSFDSKDTFTWASSAEAVATVDTKGKITGVSKGTATITATSTASKKSASVEITVVEAEVAEGEGEAAGEGEAQVPDTKAPIIILLGSQSIALTAGATYNDAGASALDDVDGNITADIVVAGVPTNPVAVGVYTVTYDVMDAAGNAAVQVTRTVTVNAAAPTNVLLSSTPPEKAACISCHDSAEAMAHADANSLGDVDTCSLCHAPGAIADPAIFHAELLQRGANGSTTMLDGVTVTINSVALNGDKPVVNFTAKIGTTTLSKAAFSSYTAATATRMPRQGVRATVAYLAADSSRPNAYYNDYLLNPLGGNAPTTDAWNTKNEYLAALTDEADGSITYRFNNSCVGIDGANAALPHQAAVQVSSVQADGFSYAGNAVLPFRPDGGTPVETREIVATEICNKCHTHLAFHGGGRTEVQYCIVCHNPQLDANDADFPEMIHKIHTGDDALFADGEGEGPFAHVALPKPIANVTIDCTQCHQDAPNADAYQDASVKGCLSCHTTVDPVSGTEHPIATSAACTLCHFEAEGGVSTVDAHKSLVDFDRIAFSVANPATDISIDEGGLLTVKFSASVAGVPVSAADLKAVAPNALYSIGILVNWLENGEYKQVGKSMSSVAPRLVDNGDGTVSYTGNPAQANDVLPVNPTFVYTVAFTGYRYYDQDGDPATSYMSGANITSTGREMRVPMAYFEPIQFKADGSAVANADKRRVSVADAKCAECHDAEFSGHGGSRVGVNVCLMCHMTTLTSTPSREPHLTLPTVTVNLKEMIHKIHRGEELESDYVTGGFRSDFDAAEILFPGRLEKCTICHVSDAAVALPVSEEALPTQVRGNPATGRQ